ncbi:hypothetical protein CFPU101_40440 [Chroococcus sp. FPU101]|nr:hypothetical protein CFPU101_40440 [Chroococcus sp. FPU101]
MTSNLLTYLSNCNNGKITTIDSRKHGSINQTPWDKWESLKAQTPTLEEVQKIYGLKKERIRDADYRADIGKPRRVIRL